MNECVQILQPFFILYWFKLLKYLGMSSSYGGSTTSSPFLEPTRLLKLRSAQTHLHNLALNRVDCNDIFSLMEPNKSVSQNFTPREVADNFASLPRESSHQIYRITSNCCESSLIDQPLVENSYGSLLSIFFIAFFLYH